jgi:hypothetical protein
MSVDPTDDPMFRALATAHAQACHRWHAQLATALATAAVVSLFLAVWRCFAGAWPLPIVNVALSGVVLAVAARAARQLAWTSRCEFRVWCHLLGHQTGHQPMAGKAVPEHEAVRNRPRMPTVETGV